MLNKKNSLMMGAALAAGLVALPALAQETGSGSASGAAGGATTSGSRTSDTTSATSTPPMGLTPRAMQLQSTLSANFDNVFLLKATQGNMAEVMTGQLAVRKARNPLVRQLAQRLVQEHSAANAQFVPVLARRALPVPRFVGAMHTATYDYLSRLKNQAFDAAYMAAQVEAHENTITLYQQELAQGTDPNARALAATLLPHILDHTAQIYSIAQAVGAPGIAERRVALTTAATGAPNFTAWTTGAMSGMSGMAGMSSTPSGSSGSSGTSGTTSSGASTSNSSSTSGGATAGSVTGDSTAGGTTSGNDSTNGSTAGGNSTSGSGSSVGGGS